MNPQFDPGPLADQWIHHLEQALDGRRRVRLVDLPYHLNIGDSLIALGQIRLLKSMRELKIIQITGRAPVSELASTVNSDEAILIHGGGNFGTIWPESHQYRVDIVEACRTCRIVQLSQSVHFSDASAARDSCRELAAHPDFHVFARDHASFDTLRNSGLERLSLVPDGAFGLPALQPRMAARSDVLMMNRRDPESRYSSFLEAIGRSLRSRWSVEFADWANYQDLPADLSSRVAKHERWLLRAERFLPLAKGRALGWSRLTRSRFILGQELLARGRVCLTDRLHVHVLCTLMGIPHIVLDNSYGKIRSFADCWGTASHASWPEPSERDVLETVDALLDG